MELKPCPFCGNDSATVREQYNWHGESIGWIVGCIGCGVETWVHRSEDSAIAAWNTRAERTCHIKEDAEIGCFLTCSECGAIQPEEWTVYYCWSCGAKVVEI